MIKVGFQMDPLDNIDPRLDTSFRLAEEAELRGYSVFHYLPNNLTFSKTRIIANGHFVKLNRKQNPSFTILKNKTIDIGHDLDILWLRQDPPFNMDYLSSTYLLDFVGNETLIVNNPFWVRNFPEKLLVLNYPQLMPATIITSRIEVIQEFREKYGDIILKPLYGNGGAGVFKINYNDKNFVALFELFQMNSTEPLIAQEFLPEVINGDKRIILLDGEILGAINRIPQKGEIRSNMHVGGKAVATELSIDEIKICEQIGSTLKEHGQIFVGIDVIGGKLTEINVTSPTGLQELEKFENKNLASKVWDKLISKI
jgi:glutathione synthase|tara:strand:+ start:135 stop:1073 length:939 start_codon:yes stop_codon:yes gene_type:complete